MSATHLRADTDTLSDRRALLHRHAPTPCRYGLCDAPDCMTCHPEGEQERNDDYEVPCTCRSPFCPDRHETRAEAEARRSEALLESMELL